ncbi:MAG: glycoside hydrolase family 5 protein [Ferruginibacter sp.]|uniref:glycoside hydrolase family 5 protein n=1 Tax=Ferruginibacter sp. TaxID=1940288 RepID=UPI002658A6DB|nr:glycoside hydrolase family 5 protein [Ferruginibacter sp.]MDB5275421.1 glycoside hydrolase family 5 protein [Ferruginibacter sp.]
MKNIFLLLCLLIVTNLAAQQKFINTRGKEIIGVDGKPFLIRGTNLGNWLVPEGYMFKFTKTSSARLINEMLLELIGPEETNIFWKKYLDNYITAADIHWLKSTGINSIRVPFNYRLFTTEDYMGGEGEARGFALLDKVIGWCKKEGLYVLLDMHCAPGGQTGDNIDDSYAYPFLFESKASRALTISIWKKIAARYKNETTVMGYDLLNEPIPHFADTARFNPMLEPLYKEITKAIREVDKNHILFLGGSQWDSNFKIFGQPFDSKLVYTFHKYWTDSTTAVIQDYIDFRNKYNVPIYCGETGENTDGWVRGFKNTLEKNNIGWHYWPYKKLDNARGFVTFNMPPHYEQVIQFADTTRSDFGDVRKNRPTNAAEIKMALEGFLNNCKFQHTIINKSYIEALGLR